MEEWRTDVVFRYLKGDIIGNYIDIRNVSNNSDRNGIILFWVYIVVILFGGIIVGFIGCLHGMINKYCKCCIREDSFGYYNTFVFIVYLWEYIGDILFVLSLYFVYGNELNDIDLNDVNTKELMLFIGLISIGVTYVINIIVFVRFICILYINEDRIKYYFKEMCCNSIFFVILGIIFNGYIVVSLFNTNLYGLNRFSMDISIYNIYIFYSMKFINIFSSNVPMFFLRLFFLVEYKELNIIVLSSFIPLIISFIITIYNTCNKKTKKNNNDYFAIKFYYSIHSSLLNMKRHYNLSNSIKYILHDILRIKYLDDIEVFKPIKHGNDLEYSFVVRCRDGMLKYILK